MDPSEEIYPKDTKQRVVILTQVEQRAKSAALMWMRDNEPKSDYEVYGVKDDAEKVKDWLTY